MSESNKDTVQALVLTSDVFGKVLFTKNGMRDEYPVWDVYLSDSTGQFYYNDSTVLEPPTYLTQQETIVYDDLANIEFERFENDFEEIFGTY